jgi:protein-S-isoprenylcysteine O-methyltransferase Ste14
MIDAIRSVFRQPALRRFVVALRVPLTLLAVAAALPLVKREWLVAGFAVSMAGEAIQLWCFAALDKNADLTIRGPYTMVRNPMYLGRFFIIGGFLLLLGSVLLLVAYTVGYWFYMDSRVGREEARLRQLFGAPYEQYCARVRRFLPGAPLAGKPVAFWSGALFRQNHGLINLLLTLVVWAAVAAWVYWRP